LKNYNSSIYFGIYGSFLAPMLTWFLFQILLGYVSIHEFPHGRTERTIQSV
jgi:hypothetical protein